MAGSPRPYWIHSSPEPVAEEGMRRCARGERCSDYILVRQGDGSYAREAKPGPRAFCDRDRGVIIANMLALPPGWERLAAEAGQLRSARSSLRTPFGPSLPLHEGMEALCREMARTLGGWHARVAAVARLTAPDPDAVLAGSLKAVTAAVRVLHTGTHIDTLLGLEEGWMTRSVAVPFRHEPEILRDPITRPPWRLPAPDWLPQPGLVQPRASREPLPPRIADELADCEIVTVGADYLTVMRQPGGATAGLDILSLYHRCELLLGEVRQHADTLDGVPCRECEDIALERAEPPSDPSRPAMYSVCASCRHMMSLEEYRAWSAWYSKWADGAGLDCVRCQRGYHERCIYDGCQCMACGHLAA